MGKSDLRAYARFECETAAKLSKREGKETFEATILDIGLGGVQLVSNKPLPVEVPLVLEIALGKENVLSFNGVVRYTTPNGKGYASGFKFAPETPEERIAIANFVNEIFRGEWEALAS